MSDGNSALDYDGSATVTGGTVIAAGYSGMAQNFGTDSTQGSILLTSRSAFDRDHPRHGRERNVLAEFTPAKAYTCVVVSTPALTQGSTYIVTMGGESTKRRASIASFTAAAVWAANPAAWAVSPDGNPGTSPAVWAPPGGNGGKGGHPGQ